MYSVYLFSAFFVPTTILYTSCTAILRAEKVVSSCVQWKILGQLQEIVDEYEKRLQEMSFVPRASYQRRMLREYGGPNRDIFTYLFCDDGFAMKFLKDVCVLRNKVQCNTCGRDMTWSAEPSIPEILIWRCRWKVAGLKCSESRSNKTGSCFRQSNLTFR